MIRLKKVARLGVARAMALLLRHRSRPLAPLGGSVLVIAPHPDDETLGCGGLIARQVLAGEAVHVAFLTDGEVSHAGHPTVGAADLAGRRKAEAMAALAVLGVADPARAATFLAAPDGELDRLTAAEADRLRCAIIDLIRRGRPMAVCVPYERGGSSEHAAACELAATACAAAGVAMVMEYPVWGWWNAFRLRPRLAPDAVNFRLGLGPMREIKRRALACHESQVRATPPWTTARLDPSHAAACCGPDEFYFLRAV